MALLTDEDKASLEIRRMIFHVVGRSLEEPVLLDEIDPPQHADFFLERVKAVLTGNLFAFRERSGTERILRAMAADPDRFAEQSRILATNFHHAHVRSTSTGVFFVFELSIGGTGSVYALVKYDNDDVVRYVLRGGDAPEVPRLERFQESFVRKPEAMQKIALVRLGNAEGGHVAVRDRSRLAHISDYFEGFLQVRRVGSPADLSVKLLDALKATFKDHLASLPPDVRKGGVGRIYEVLRQKGRTFDPTDCEPLVTAIFGVLPADAPLRRTLARKLRDGGIAEETFEVDAGQIPPPRRRRLETSEGTLVIYEVGNEPEVRPREDGRKEILIVTSGITIDDVDTQNDSGRR